MKSMKNYLQTATEHDFIQYEKKVVEKTEGWCKSNEAFQTLRQ